MLSFWWLCFYMTQKLVEDKFFQLHNFLWVHSTFWQGKSTHPHHNCPIYNRHPEICSKKTDFSCWHKHRLGGQNLKVSLLITCSAKFRIIPFKCHLMSTLSRKKVFFHFFITLSLMVLLNRVLPLLFKCAVSKIYRTNLWNSNSNLTQPDKWRDQILGSNLSFFKFFVLWSYFILC